MALSTNSLRRTEKGIPFVLFTLDFYERRQAVTCVSLCRCHCVTIEAIGSVWKPCVCLG